ncbi:hypothetical protein Pmar_PMAR019009, partial [Perkinsus marinus ATCC 50983]
VLTYRSARTPSLSSRARRRRFKHASVAIPNCTQTTTHSATEEPHGEDSDATSQDGREFTSTFKDGND